MLPAAMLCQWVIVITTESGDFVDKSLIYNTNRAWLGKSKIEPEGSNLPSDSAPLKIA